MQLVKYTRPKMPRNKYGYNSNVGFFSSGMIEEGGTILPDENDNQNNTTTTTTINNYYDLEWYNIQNKVVHSYGQQRDTAGNIIKINRKDSEGNIMYDENGDAILVPKLKLLSSTWVVTIEGYQGSKGLRNNNEYRFFLMRLRKNKREGRRWRIPWFSPKYQKTGDGVQNTRMDIEEQDCWWDVSGAETKWWNNSQIIAGTETDEEGNETTIYRNKDFKDVLPVSGDHIKTDTNGNYIFKNCSSRTMTVGCALFKKTGTGAFGWQRVSNIATMKIKLSKTGSLNFEANYD